MFDQLETDRETNRQTDGWNIYRYDSYKQMTELVQQYLSSPLVNSLQCSFPSSREAVNKKELPTYHRQFRNLSREALLSFRSCLPTSFDQSNDSEKFKYLLWIPNSNLSS